MTEKTIVAISDTHTMHDRVAIPDGDILIHAGDATGRGMYAEIESFLYWFVNQPHEHKIFIAGNHDFNFSSLRNRKLPNDVIYLEDSSFEIDGIKFYGTPWSREFFNWAFNASPEKLREKFTAIPEDTDVLITHTPPHGILDTVAEGEEHLGSRILAGELPRIQPKVHIFGHIHGGYGWQLTEDTDFINASICTERYVPSNKAMIYKI